MREKPGCFDSVKFDAIANARKQGITDPEELERIGQRAKLSEIERIGNESEERYLKYMEKYRKIEVTPATPQEDVYDGIDFWERVDEKIDLPVQVKSGPGDVRAFRDDRRYKNRHEIFLVFNVGPSVSQRDFDKQHEEELTRVKAILKHRNIHFI